ncbi:patatin-like phospholipase family protein [Alteromonas sp. ASW11-19]|uniref:Patatin-like phospholipase family protein n=1 Tax=Alteromonas salexigens TaxID=2982530 RepID=A0ABT2VKP9_9ALTE|nr:patatin-like phospholipase family protein [Alteromonas salexigens]MCU7553870.1 patatin-like phospholipase family protein [Alteromonas salexigens]
MLRRYGFHPDLFNYFVGASGGPKWFTLAGIDRVLFPYWLGCRNEPLNIIGSSAGAFRAACAVQSNPLRAFDRLAYSYVHTVYSKKPTKFEITQKAKALIKDLLGEDGRAELVMNQKLKAHFIAARCRGPMRSESKVKQLGGLAMTAAANAMSRKNLQHFYTRTVFSHPDSTLEVNDPYNLPTEYVPLSIPNIDDALLASGSIPMIIDGVRHILDAPRGVYRDGGIIDYHFDVEFGPGPGLVLFPHFYPKPIPGWFDKGLKNRIPHAVSYFNMVMLVPSEDFVSRLPYGKIPDRRDFEVLDDKTRIAYWIKVLNEAERVGEYFLDLVHKEKAVDAIKPLPFETIPYKRVS